MDEQTNMTPTTKQGAVYIVDDDDAVRDSLKILLGNTGFAVKTFPDALAFLENYDPQNILCALIDVRMPGMDGMELLNRLAKLPPLPPIVIITGHGEVEMAVKALKIGAFDFIEKPFVPEALIERVKAAVRWGEQSLAQKLKESEAHKRLAALTPREMDVLRHLLSGLANKAIAERLGLSPRTVEVHRAHIMEKTQANSLSHLIRLCVLAGLDPETEAPPA